MKLQTEAYRDKVLGCWMGKNIGGTLGEPFEWYRQINDVDFYTQDLQGEPLANDDLDIQLLWLIALEEQGLGLDSRQLAEYWMLYVTPHWAEYGNAKINMRAGMMPPLSGMINNDYKHSCGAFIRSEIWACLFPGAPWLAAKYAYEDAIIDHGDGEGVFAEIFTASLESAAFVEADLNTLIAIGLSYIPQDSGVAQAVKLVQDSYEEGVSWLEARDRLLTEYRGRCHFGRDDRISERDKELGFASGRLGWDAPSNIGILVIGLLWGDGDFDQTLCTAVNCGEDTDCTAATLGSIWGIIHGMEAIPERWVEPIGRSIKTACLNLGELGHYGGQIPATVDELTDRIVAMASQAAMHYEGEMAMGAHSLYAGSFVNQLYVNWGQPVFRFGFFDVAVEYSGGPYISAGQPKTVKLSIENRYKVQEIIQVRWYCPEGWTVWPSPISQVFVAQRGLQEHRRTVEFTIQAHEVPAPISRCAIECTVQGRHSVMLVPLVFHYQAIPSAGMGEANASEFGREDG